MSNLLLFFSFVLPVFSAQKILVESVIARIANEPVLLSEVRQFVDVIEILECAGLREKSKVSTAVPKKDDQRKLQQYIEDELIYLDARGNSVRLKQDIRNVVSQIKSKRKCAALLRELDKSLATLYRSGRGVSRGGAVLLRQLEKALLVEQHKRDEVRVQSSTWVSEAKSRTKIEVFLN